MLSVATRPITQAVDGQNADSPVSLVTNNHAGGVDQGIHAYKCPGEDDLRSVCPALNTLANHSYIPHDGRHITFFTLAHALHAGYGISIGFANFLVLGSNILLKSNPLGSLDLHEISRHDCIEHNGSVVHGDADSDGEYAPSQVDADLLCKLLKKAYSPPTVHKSESEDIITVEDLAYARIARQAESGPIDPLHAEIARGEFAMVLNIFGKATDNVLDTHDLELWLKDNRFPDGWFPKHTETLSQTMAESKKMRELVERYQSGPEKEHRGLWVTIEKAVEGFQKETTAHLYK